jgi:hypothetical protein
VKLPSGVSEPDLQRVTKILLKTGDEIDLIEKKTGEVYVLKDSVVREVEVIDVAPRALAFSPTMGLGASIGTLGDRLRLSPALTVSVFEWWGWLHAPTAAADIDGLGGGAEVRLYHDIFIGAARLWRYDEGASVKLTIVYTL